MKITPALALKWFLRYTGIVSCLAVVAVAMPLSWMNITHNWLGMGNLPEGPIVNYLARGLSAMYVIFGIFLILLSADVRRHSRLISWMFISSTLLEFICMPFNIKAGMPSWWSLGEPVVVAVMTVVVLTLQAKVRSSTPPTAGT